MPNLVGNPLASRDQQIADLAYRLWEEEGQPHGRAESHWLRAAEILSSETAKQPKPKPVSSAKSRKKAS